MRAALLTALLSALALLGPALPLRAQEVVIGSKTFTESVILGEVARFRLMADGVTVRHDRAMGGTRILYEALRRGEIDVYPDYTGTLMFETYAGEGVQTLDDLRARLAEDGLAMTDPLGFNNTYEMTMRRDHADRLGIESISDLAERAGLRAGFSNEFMDRGDGWPALRRAYGLDLDPNGMSHELSYRALAEGRVDVIDAYGTDPEIAYYDLVTLEDDRGFFPEYRAVLLYRQALQASRPDAVRALGALAGSLDVARMRAMNEAVQIDRARESDVARDFVGDAFGLQAEADRTRSLFDRIAPRVGEHLALSGISLAAAILIALPLGIVAWRRRRLGAAILAGTGLMQTIPALALFVFMIPLLGIGAEPTIAALFLYSLLPIVRNTHAGMAGIDPELRESAHALGLDARARLLRIELPLALPMILAGVKTAAVINIGAATLGALIGAGGLGQPILTGIRLDDIGLILEGAVPAAILALLATAAFDGLERLLTPRGLRL